MATLWTTEGDLEDIERLRQEGVQVEAVPLPFWRSAINSLQALPSRTPLQARYCWQPTFAQKLNTIFASDNGCPPFDAVHIEHLRGACFGLHLKTFLDEMYGMQRPPLIWDSVDCISFLFRQAANQSKSLKGRLMTQLELKRTEQYEAWLASQFDRVLLTSPHDRQAFLDLIPAENVERLDSKLTVLPNGVDLAYFCPDPTVRRDPATLVISGKMSYHANVTMVVNFVDQVMPIVWDKEPFVKLMIVGKDPTHSILTMGEHPQIEVTGTVPDLRPYLQKATVAVAPVSYGAGIQNKVLEAMACATPVVATSQAVSALTAIAGQDVLVGDDPLQIADLILKLVNDPIFSQKIGDNGYQFVSQQHDWANITERLETYYLAK